jgi:hypothetical protein
MAIITGKLTQQNFCSSSAGSVIYPQIMIHPRMSHFRILLFLLADSERNFLKLPISGRQPIKGVLQLIAIQNFSRKRVLETKMCMLPESLSQHLSGHVVDWKQSWTRPIRGFGFGDLRM